ncbi:MAG: Maf family protein [Myxococcota bacterium]|nr:Maf family protein [Myxococcota bacterium]
MIVLASSSPRRHQLLDMLNIEHVIDPAEIDERPQDNESPESLALRLARNKAATVASRHPGRLVLGADTLVVLRTEILGKPTSQENAIEMLEKMAGQKHEVVTAVALATDDKVSDRIDVTSVWFRPLDEDTIKAYVATGEPLDKAGSYGVQGYGAMLVDRIEGDFFSVMGLPVRLVGELLEEAGIAYRFTR